MTARVLWALSVLALSNQLAAQEGAPFVPGCPVPFAAPEHHSIDDDCGIEGVGASPAKLLENKVNHPPKCTGDPPSFRAGKWEIHPVYSVEVCKHKSLTTCDARTDSEWKDLKAWLDEQQEGPDP